MIKKIKKFFFNTDVRCIINYQYASFDVFDTLIFRKCKLPHLVFDLVESKINDLGCCGLVQNFKNNRMAIEMSLRKRNVEVSLNEIYDEIKNKYGAVTSRILKDLEIETELEQCVANPQMVKIYNAYAQNHDVFITSDMYLPASVITEILQKNNIRLPKKMYISCEHRKTKRNRQLFKLVLRENLLRGHELIHIGDNVVSDYINPKLVGMRSCLYVE